MEAGTVKLRMLAGYFDSPARREPRILGASLSEINRKGLLCEIEN
jgi:hypothetical protein